MKTMTLRALIIGLNLISFVALAQWNRNAGVNYPESHNAVSIATSENSTYTADNVIDDNPDSYWQSANPFPNNFFSRNDQNILFGMGNSASITASAGSSFADATDGSLTTNEYINASGSNWLAIDFPQGQYMRLISIKAHFDNGDPLEVYVFDQAGDSVKVGDYTSNNSTERYMVLQNVYKIKLECNSPFHLFEIGATSGALHEDIVVDLGQAKEIGWIYSRLHSNDMDSAFLDVSNDNINWTTVAHALTNSSDLVPYHISPAVNARYVRVKCFVKEDNAKRANVNEVNVYDKSGRYGALTAPVQATKPLSDMIGLNGIWGWGNNMSSKNLSATQGPHLYNKVVKYARNYHNMSWDTNDPDNTPNYNGMPGSLNLGWLNWDDEYGSWQSAGIQPEICIQFTSNSQPESKWNDPYQAAYDYGFAFASHFGPTSGNGKVKSLEVGNEPWDYDSTFYRSVLKGMAKGVKDADPAMRVFPCALQSTDPLNEATSGRKNYMGSRITATEAQYLDGINSHHYSYMYNANGDRIATYPENPASGMRGIADDIRFRNANMPGKEVYVSEWGWDSDGAGQSCTHGECVSEKAQAIYAVRGLLMMNRLGVNRATWFFYQNGNSTTSSLYSRCGLTGSVENGSPKKRSFYAFQTIQQRMGNSYFLDTLVENDNAWAYLYGDSLGHPTQIVAWKPISETNGSTSQLQINGGYIADSAWSISGLNVGGTPIATPASNGGTLTLNISATPILVQITATNSVYQKEYQKIENAISVYPNPAHDQCAVEINATDAGTLKVFLLSIDGRLLQSRSTVVSQGSNTIKLDVSSLTPGCYIIKGQINGSSNKVYTSKLIITR